MLLINFVNSNVIRFIWMCPYPCQCGYRLLLQAVPVADKRKTHQHRTEWHDLLFISLSQACIQFARSHQQEFLTGQWKVNLSTPGSGISTGSRILYTYEASEYDWHNIKQVVTLLPQDLTVCRDVFLIISWNLTPCWTDFCRTDRSSSCRHSLSPQDDI